MWSILSGVRGERAEPSVRQRDGAAARPALPVLVRLFLVAVVALGAMWIAAPVASAGTTYHAVGKPLCKAPKVGHAACFAERRVSVKKGTPGARAFKLGAGATAGSVSPNAQTIGPAGGITPFDLATAYGFDSLTSASSQTVAIVDAFNDPTIEADLQKFDAQYALATCTTANGCFKKVNQAGASSPLPATDTGWSGEIALDVETVHAVCQTCHILLVEANDSSLANLEAAANEAAKLKATEISNSYGGAGTPGSSDLAAYNHPGIVITASTGDDGYYSFDQYALGGVDPGLPEFPAAANTVVAVGGTSLYLGQNATRQSESVWNDNGTKDYWEQNCSRLSARPVAAAARRSRPRAETGLSVWASTACGTHRLPADISSDADDRPGSTPTTPPVARGGARSGGRRSPRRRSPRCSLWRVERTA